jgi:hypothetical protein
MKLMNSVSRTVLASFLAGALMPVAAFAATQVGVNAAVRNHVDMKTDADAALRPALVREPVHLGDLVVSGDKSSLQMLLLDHSVFTIGANASITIDRFVYDPDKGTTDIAASVAKGAFRFMSGRLTGNAGQSAIKTPVATIGVRGTIVEGVVGPDALNVLAGQPGAPQFTGDPNNIVLVLLDGPGRHGQGFDKPGAIDVSGEGGPIPIEHAGMAIVIMPGQPIWGPFDLSDDAYQRLQALLAEPPGGEGNPDQPSIGGSVAVQSSDIDDQGSNDTGTGTVDQEQPPTGSLPFPSVNEDSGPPIDGGGGDY